MKRFLLLVLGFSALIGCHKDSPSKKIIDGLPVAIGSTVVQPAQATQQYLLLKNVVFNLLITNLNRLSIALPNTGLTGPDAALNYTAQRLDSHYGSATFVFQFQDVNSTTIDPFTTAFASAAVKYVHITSSSTSNTFRITENLIFSLDTVGILTGPYHVSGTSQFNNSSYSIIYTLDPAGVEATISGILRGHASSASTLSSPKQTSSALTFGVVSDVSGTLNWDDQTAGIHVASDGSGYLTTSDSRILFQ